MAVRRRWCFCGRRCNFKLTNVEWLVIFINNNFINKASKKKNARKCIMRIMNDVELI